MTAFITSAHLSGPLGQALAIADGETWLYEASGNRRRPTRNEIKFFFDLGLEVRPVNLDGAELCPDALQSQLGLETRCFRALRGLLGGMDREIDHDLRRRHMDETEALLADPAVAEFVARRFLRPAETKAWDISGALDIAETAALTAVARLYAIVKGPLLFDLKSEIMMWSRTKRLSSLECAAILEGAQESGLLAIMASAIFDGDVQRLSEQRPQSSRSAQERRLVAHLLSRFGGPRAARRQFHGPFRPLHDRVVVRRVGQEEKTRGGIIIPDTAKEKSMEGEIVAVGLGARDDKGHIVPPDVKPGDRILFGKWSGTEVKIDGEELLIMKESDIMGVIEGAAKSARKVA